MEKHDYFNIILLDFLMPAPCEISVSPRREHDFASFAFSSGYLKSVEKIMKNIQKTLEKRLKIVIENELFFNIDFSSIFAPFWEVFGEVLGGFW